MNGALRSNPDGPAPLNNIIASMPPLDKDIVVFRYIYNDQFLPKEIGSTFQSLGYFSTTMNPVLTASRVCFMKTRGSPVKDPTKEVVAVMRIHVMKGTRAIYIPGGEYELIFAHNIELQLVSYKTGKFLCAHEDVSSEHCYIVDDVLIYTYNLLA